MWQPGIRYEIVASGECGRSVFRELEIELLGLVGSKSGADVSCTGENEASSWRSVVNELRLQLYQIIGRLASACVVDATTIVFPVMSTPHITYAAHCL